MSSPHGRPSGGAVGKGVALTLVAVAVGVFILDRAFDARGSGGPEAAGSDAPADAEGEGGDGDGLDDMADISDAADIGQDAPDGADTGSLLEAEQIVPLVTRRPEDVKAVAVNGTSTRGLAGATANILNAQGYVTDTKNAASPPVLLSSIFYQAGYHDDAKAVAAALSAPADIIASAPDHVLTLIASPSDVDDFHIFVVLGVDNRIPVSAG